MSGGRAGPSLACARRFWTTSSRTRIQSWFIQKRWWEWHGLQKRSRHLFQKSSWKTHFQDFLLATPTQPCCLKRVPSSFWWPNCDTLGMIAALSLLTVKFDSLAANNLYKVPRYTPDFYATSYSLFTGAFRRVMDVLEKTQFVVTPPKDSWIVLDALDRIVTERKIFVSILQSKTISVVEQVVHLNSLKNRLTQSCTVVEAVFDDAVFIVKMGRVSKEMGGTNHTWRSRDISFRPDRRNIYSKTEKQESNVAYLFVGLVFGTNLVRTVHKKTTFHQLCLFRWFHCEENCLVRWNENLKLARKLMSLKEKTPIGWRKHQDLLGVYGFQCPVQNQINADNGTVRFNIWWEPFRALFKYLKDVSTVLSCMFPSSVNVEANLSVIKWKKNPYKMSLTNFSLEEIL